MRTIRLLLILLVLLLSFAVLAVPYFTGVAARQQMVKLEKTVAGTPLQLVASDYEQGWFNSVTETSFTSQNIQGADFKLKNRIDHGLLPVRPLVIYSTLLTSLSDIIGKAAPLEAQTTLQANGNVQSHFQMPSLKLHDPQSHFQLDWQGLQGKFLLEQDSNTLHTETRFPQFHFSHLLADFSIDNIDIHSRLRYETSSRLLVGELTFKLEKMYWNSPLSAALQLMDWQVTLSSDVKAGELALTLDQSLQRLKIGRRTILGPLHVQLELQRLDAASFSSLLYTLSYLNTPERSSAQRGLMLFNALMQDGVKLFSRHPQLIIRQFTIDTPEGNASGTLQIKAQRFNPLALMNPSFALDDLEGELVLQWPLSLILHILNETTGSPLLAQKRLTQWQEQGILQATKINESSQYLTHVNLKNGIFQVNGETQPDGFNSLIKLF